MKRLLQEIRACQHCAPFLAHSPRPVLQASEGSRVVILGQAPGRAVHRTGIPWDDPSGRRLREWLQLTDEQFYDPDLVALIPMGFCYPGKGASGDLPPRPECAPLWHGSVMSHLARVQLTLVIGLYAQNYYLNGAKGVTDSVKRWREFWPPYFPLPHPSPRNNLWLKKNPWFERDVLPHLREQVRRCLLPDPERGGD